MTKHFKHEIKHARYVPIHIRYIPFRYIVGEAIRDHNRVAAFYKDYDAMISGKVTRKYLIPIIVNYIRHNLTNYDDILINMREIGYSECCISNARQVLKSRVNRMIYEKWRIDEYTYTQKTNLVTESETMSY